MGVNYRGVCFDKQVLTKNLVFFWRTQICTKRGPLGACLETVTRTTDNDNDKSNTYFKAAAESKLRKDSEALAAENEASTLIQKLRQQSSDNREKNDLLVQQKTFMNDQVSLGSL